MDSVSLKQTVLLLWDGSSVAENIKSVAESLNSRVGSEGKVQLENVDRLELSQHASSAFDCVLSGFCGVSSQSHTPKVLAEVVRILKPNGNIYLREIASSANGFKTPQQLEASLKLSGFVDVSSNPANICDEEKIKAKEMAKADDVEVLQITAKKPNYEVGASSQLSFGTKLNFASKPTEKKPAANVGEVWSLSANDMLDDDIIDSDDLLDESDKQKPDPASLRAACGGEKKKKACKDCTCGLAEELADDKPVQQKSVTSSCGSCYLGDAFRCASCPYLGMPAFKPGEKISLSNRQLNADK